MSDSDDTDLLLLIPPDFFLVNSDNDDLNTSSREVEREVVSSLITQVNDLESRICAIENSDGSRSRLEDEELTITSTPIKQICCREASESRNTSTGDRFNSGPSVVTRNDNTCKGSNFYDRSLPLVSKHLEVGLNSRPTSDNLGSEKQQVRGPSEMNQIPRTGEPVRMKETWSPSKRLDLPEVDRLLKEMENTQAEIESKLRMREMELGTHTSLKPDTQKRLTQCGDNIGSVPDLGFGIRAMFDSSPKTSPTKGSNKKEGKNPVIEDPCVKKSITPLGSSRLDTDNSRWKSYLSHDYPRHEGRTSVHSPPRLKACRRRLNVTIDSSPNKSTLEHELNFSNTEKKNFPSLSVDHNDLHEVQKLKALGLDRETEAEPARLQLNKPMDLQGIKRIEDKEKPKLPSSSAGDKLLSLNELWQPEEGLLENPLRLRQKLEEEQYRRMHLEQTIEALQKKVLEEQEKVAVAVKVDEAKDRAIGQMTEGWKRMVDHWRRIEEQRHQMAQALITEKAASKKLQEDVAKKLERWEKEVSQALDLAAGYKNKCERLEGECFSIREELSRAVKEATARAEQAERSAATLQSESSALASSLLHAQQDLTQERKLVEDTQNEKARMEDAIKKLEAELSVSKEQLEQLTMRLKEERGRCKTLESRAKGAEVVAEEAEAARAKAEEEVALGASRLDAAKTELRALYQGQLETVVKEKLAEFQAQLDAAQSAMDAELSAERRRASERATHQHQTLITSHVVEMRRLESMHKEELRNLERRLVEAETKCARLEEGKKEVAQKLHRLMEAQWQQALSIITTEMSSRQTEPDNKYRPETEEVKEDMRQLELNTQADSGASSGTSLEEAPFNKDGQLTYRVGGFPGNRLMKYIQELLEKQPGHPVDSMTSTDILQDVTASDIVEENPEALKWNELMMRGQKGQKDAGSYDPKAVGGRSKPPWK